MGRELKRVPLWFQWPIGQIWKGYTNSYPSQMCDICKGTGLNEATNKLQDQWYSFDEREWMQTPHRTRYNNKAWQHHLTDVEVEALAKAGRLWGVMKEMYYYDKDAQTWMISKGRPLGWQPCDAPTLPTAQAVNEWYIHKEHHDAINRWTCVEARAKSLGIYGECEHCGGEGEIWQSEEQRKLHDDWEPYDPPVGEGYQLWCTTTEGHPMSPVFYSLDLLCQWLEDNKVSFFGDITASAQKWKDTLSGGLFLHQDGNNIFI